MPSLIRRVIALFLLLTCGLGWAEALQPQKLAEGVYVLIHGDGEQTPANSGWVGNRGFVIGASGVAVINPGPNRRYGQALLAAIRRLTALPILAVIDTQARPEQTLAGDVFREAGVPLLAGAATAALMAERCERCLLQSTQDAGEAAMAGTRIALPQGTLQDGQVLDLGGRRLRLFVFEAGMVPGQTAVLDEASGVLFTGAALNLDHIPSLRDARIPAAIAALDRLAAMPARWVLPDRGPLAAPARIAEFRRYLSDLQTQAAAAFEAGLSAEETMNQVRLPDFAPWQNYARQHSANVLKVYLGLESEG